MAFWQLFYSGGENTLMPRVVSGKLTLAMQTMCLMLEFSSFKFREAFLTRIPSSPKE